MIIQISYVFITCFIKHFISLRLSMFMTCACLAYVVSIDFWHCQVKVKVKVNLITQITHCQVNYGMRVAGTSSSSKCKR